MITRRKTTVNTPTVTHDTPLSSKKSQDNFYKTGKIKSSSLRIVANNHQQIHPIDYESLAHAYAAKWIENPSYSLEAFCRETNNHQTENKKLTRKALTSALLKYSPSHYWEKKEENKNNFEEMVQLYLTEPSENEQKFYHEHKEKIGRGHIAFQSAVKKEKEKRDSSQLITDIPMIQRIDDLEIHHSQSVTPNFHNKNGTLKTKTNILRSKIKIVYDYIKKWRCNHEYLPSAFIKTFSSQGIQITKKNFYELLSKYAPLDYRIAREGDKKKVIQKSNSEGIVAKNPSDQRAEEFIKKWILDHNYRLKDFLKELHDQGFDIKQPCLSQAVSRCAPQEYWEYKKAKLNNSENWARKFLESKGIQKIDFYLEHRVEIGLTLSGFDQAIDKARKALKKNEETIHFLDEIEISAEMDSTDLETEGQQKKLPPATSSPVLSKGIKIKKEKIDYQGDVQYKGKYRVTRKIDNSILLRDIHGKELISGPIEKIEIKDWSPIWALLKNFRRVQREEVKNRILQDCSSWLQPTADRDQMSHELVSVFWPVEEEGPIRGFSLFAARDLPEATIIGPYGGILLATEEEIRSAKNKQGARNIGTYLFGTHGEAAIDAFSVGTTTSLANAAYLHGKRWKSINATWLIVTVNEQHLPFLITRCHIQEEKEILAGYTKKYNPDQHFQATHYPKRIKRELQESK